MFEQSLIQVSHSTKRPYPVLVSLLLQVTTIGVFLSIPLIYTQVLPRARLQTIFEIPTPPPPPLLKAPVMPARSALIRQVRSFFPTGLGTPAITRNPEMNAAATTPELPTGIPVGDDSLPIGIPDGTQIKPPDPPQLPSAHTASVTKRVRFASIDPSQLIHQVQPAYPILAKQVHLQGPVLFTAVISKVGTIENLQLVSGHPLLVLAARNAIMQWRYKPTLLNGEPVEVITNIVVNFTLNE